MARHSKGRMFSSHSRGAINARVRRIIIICSSIVVLFLVTLIVGYYQLLAYLQGNDFRQFLSEKAQSATGAQIFELSSNLDIDGSRVATNGVEISSLGKIELARVGRISSDIDRTALFSRKLHVRKLSMEDASLSINTSSRAAGKAGKTKKPATRNTAAKPQKESAPAAAPKTGFKASDIALDLVECKDTDLQLVHNKKKYQLLGAGITAMPAPKIGKNAWHFTVENARLHTPLSFLRDSSVKSATVVYHNQNIDLTECQILLTPGEMRVKAHYGLKKQKWTADMQVNKANLHRIISEDWRKRVSGDLYGRMTISGSSGKISDATGSFFVQNGVLEGLPFLSQLPLGNSRPYRSIELEKADCQVLFPYNAGKIKPAWLFDKINIQAKDGLLLVRGHILIGQDKRLGGTLTIGVPEGIAAALPVSSEALTSQLFTAQGEEPGYLWVNMNLSGTLDDPQEDLSVRIAAIAGQSLGKLLNSFPKGTAAQLLNTLLQQPRPAEASDEESQEAPTEDEPVSPSPIQNAAEAAGSLLQSLF